MQEGQGQGQGQARLPEIALIDVMKMFQLMSFDIVKPHNSIKKKLWEYALTSPTERLTA